MQEDVDDEYYQYFPDGIYDFLLEGMKETIRRNKPILAVCVYHLRDDFYKLTDFIEGLMPGEYKYFMRQYRYTPTETVCYMVPKERVKC